ncbi:MAG: MerR family transcriptional regulator [Proteobacteria bacterium]|nr:MerR family transcriptional regulator [Pseudomonadota bacterium]
MSSMTIPHKSSFKFGELTSLTGIKPYVIRFWETEFSELNPVVAEDGQKTYSRADVETLLKIKTLLFDHKLSLQEAKAAIRDPEWKMHEKNVVANVSSATTYVQENVKESLLEALSVIKSVKSRYHW